MFVLLNLNLPTFYMTFILFFTFKWIFNYRKCTISYIECAIRGVNKEQGYLFTFLENIINLRYTKDIKIYYILSLVLIIYYFIYKRNSLHKIIN